MCVFFTAGSYAALTVLGRPPGSPQVPLSEGETEAGSPLAPLHPSGKVAGEHDSWSRDATSKLLRVRAAHSCAFTPLDRSPPLPAHSLRILPKSPSRNDHHSPTGLISSPLIGCMLFRPTGLRSHPICIHFLFSGLCPLPACVSACPALSALSMQEDSREVCAWPDREDV